MLNREPVLTPFQMAALAAAILRLPSGGVVSAADLAQDAGLEREQVTYALRHAGLKPKEPARGRLPNRWAVSSLKRSLNRADGKLRGLLEQAKAADVRQQERTAERRERASGGSGEYRLRGRPAADKPAAPAPKPGLDAPRRRKLPPPPEPPPIPSVAEESQHSAADFTEIGKLSELGKTEPEPAPAGGFAWPERPRPAPAVAQDEDWQPAGRVRDRDVIMGVVAMAVIPALVVAGIVGFGAVVVLRHIGG